MDPMNWLAGGAVIGVLTSCWGYIKGFSWKIVSIFIQRIEIGKYSEGLKTAVIGYMLKNYRSSGVYDRFYEAAETSILLDDEVKSGLVPYEHIGNRTLIFWSGIFPVIYGIATPQKSSDNDSAPGSESAGATLTFLRGTFGFEKMMAEAAKEYNKQRWNTSDVDTNQRFFVKYVPDFQRVTGNESLGRNSNGLAWYREDRYKLLCYGPKELNYTANRKENAIDKLIFPKHVMELIDEIKLWRNNKEWYQRRNIPWKRGWLLYGPGGTGKTALARAFAEDLDMPIYVYNLGELGNFDFMRNWTKMQGSAPCIALIEDIDNVFHGRSNVSNPYGQSLLSMLKQKKKQQNNENDDQASKGGMLSFDVFLNMLDGVERNEGIFTIITTNDIAKVDPALGQPVKDGPNGHKECIATRPGRIDRAIELGVMTVADKPRLAKRILGEYPEALAAVLEEMSQLNDPPETPAQVQERCSRVALKCFWEQLEREKGHATNSNK